MLTYFNLTELEVVEKLIQLMKKDNNIIIEKQTALWNIKVSR